MGRFAILFSILVASSLVFTGANGTIQEARRAFPSKIYEAVTKTLSNDVNRVFSPYGVKLLLGMMYAGSRGVTSREIRKAMTLEGARDSEIFEDFQNTLLSLKSQSSVQLVSANQAFVNQNYPLKSKYKDTIKSTFRADAQPIDTFDSQGSAQKINDWVRKNTNGKIQEIVSAASFKGDDTALVLTNAIYFKAKWDQPFAGTSASFEGKFYTNPRLGEYVNATFMTNRNEFPHVRIPEIRAQAVLLPYEGKRFAMIAVISDEPNGFVELEERIGNGFDLTSLPDKVNRDRTIDVWFPRFKIESEISFTDRKERILEYMGLQNLTKTGADFSGMVDRPIYVSDFIQKTVLEVTEDGTEAASAGAIFAQPLSARQILTFNRPFLGYIIDTDTKAVLFMFRKTS